MSRPDYTAIVPTLGSSPWLEACLGALRREGRGSHLEIVVVDQGERPLALSEDLADRILRLETNRGFAAANNLVLAQTQGELVALVNDDAVMQGGWLGQLAEALERDPQAAAAQGVNLRLDHPELTDGCGLAWNRWWQAIQIGRGEPPAPSTAPVCEVFGVSATAALYRRRALESVARSGGEVFDERLFAYYEDVDLACRLRAAGWRALLVPAARAHHAGSATGATLGLGSRPWIYGNRYLVLAALWGRGFWPRLPWLWLRDAADLCQALARRDGRAARGIASGWARALRLLPRFAHLGRARLAPAVMRSSAPSSSPG